jgi:hypothetical protein
MNSEITKLTAVVARSCHSLPARPSPAGGGRIIRRLCERRDPEFAGRSFAKPESAVRCSLSPGEKVRVMAIVQTIPPSANSFPR